MEKTPLDEAKIFNIAAQDKHAILAVILREQELWVGLRLASGAQVDRRNFASKIKKSWKRERFLELLQELPEGALIGCEDSPMITSDVDDEVITNYVGNLGPDDPAWELGYRLSPGEAIEMGLDLPDYIGRWLGAFMPFYRFGAWSRDNDFIAATKQIEEEKAQKQHQLDQFKEGDKVRVIEGLFAGKVGVIESIENKGEIKVQVGLMSVVLKASTVTRG